MAQIKEVPRCNNFPSLESQKLALFLFGFTLFRMLQEKLFTRRSAIFIVRKIKFNNLAFEQ